MADLKALLRTFMANDYIGSSIGSPEGHATLVATYKHCGPYNEPPSNHDQSDFSRSNQRVQPVVYVT